jgi:dienelactone hydrolase
MARIMAMNGYKALAVDLYNGQVATNMETAMQLSQ